MSRLSLGRTRLILLLSSAAFAVSGVAVVALVDTRPPTVTAREWVAANSANLPTDYDELAKYPVAYRLAAFRAHTPEIRSRLAREHFTRFRSGNSLTPSQDKLIGELIAALGPEVYSPTGRDAQEALKGMCARIGALFSKEQAALLGTLGPPPTAESQVVSWLRTAKKFTTAYILHASVLEDCTCAVRTDCSGCVLSGGNCYPGNCDSHWPGCGCGFAFTCDGQCVPLPVH